MMKQKGFTLLELLVVVTILAVLAAGALVAYDGVGESSKSAADANNIATIDQAVRTYKVVESKLPNQWDALLADNGTALAAGILDTGLTDILVRWTNTNASGVGSSVADAFVDAGFDEIQTIVAGTTQAQAAAVTGGINNAHSESFAGALASEKDVEATQNWAVVAARQGSTGAATCTVGGADDIGATNLSGGTLTANNLIMGQINDSFLEGNRCHLVIALGFGNDAAASTTGSPAAIQSAAVSSSVNKETYGRYIALFHVGQSNTGSNAIGEIFTTPRFIGLLAPNGKTLSQSISLSKGGN